MFNMQKLALLKDKKYIVLMYFKFFMIFLENAIDNRNKV